MIHLSLPNTVFHMKKVTVNLDILTNHALSFDQYLVLYHIHTGKFESEDSQWFAFDEGVFSELYIPLKRPGVGPILTSLKHRKFIELKSSGLFRVVNKSLFNIKNSSKRPAADILSFRKDLKSGSVKVEPLLIRSTKLGHFQSEEFKKVAGEFQKMRSEKGDPLTESKAERMAKRLIRLSANNEQTAILILRESEENGWTGIFPLKNVAAPIPVAQDRRHNVDQWYPSAKP